MQEQAAADTGVPDIGVHQEGVDAQAAGGGPVGSSAGLAPGPVQDTLLDQVFHTKTIDHLPHCCNAALLTAGAAALAS